MTWGKVDDKLHGHPKVLAAGNEAMGLWVRALSYCCAYLTDGVVTRYTLVTLAGQDAEELARRLVDAGLWHVDGDGWRFHDWAEYQPTSEKVKESRRSTADRVRRFRSGQNQKVIARDGECVYCGAKVDLSVDHVIPFSRGGGSDEGNLVAACRKCNSSKCNKTPEEWEQAGLRLHVTRYKRVSNTAPVPVPVPSLERDLRAVPKAAAPAGGAPDKPARKAKAKADGGELPLGGPANAGRLQPLDALALITAAAGGRFPRVEPRDMARHHYANINGHLESYPSAAEWTRVGRWLAAGGLGYRKDLNHGWVASSDFRGVMASARAWEAGGCKPVEGGGPGKRAAAPVDDGNGWNADDEAEFAHG